MLQLPERCRIVKVVSSWHPAVKYGGKLLVATVVKIDSMLMSDIIISVLILADR